MQSLTNISEVKSLLSRHGFSFSKALGQNFLINPSVSPRMAKACGAGKNTGVLEIGPGIGVLTRELAALAYRVAAVEIDSRLLPVLNETLADFPNAKVIHGDVMKLDLQNIIAREFGGLKTVICANLPYYITSPVLMKLLESRLPAESITVMVQKEAADRICALPGTRECGAVTLAVWYYSIPKKLFSVSRGSFMPAPKVDSAVIKLDIRKSPPVEVRDEKAMFRLIRAAFAQRRKTLANSLTAAGLTREQTISLLDKAGIPRQSRAEQLTLEQFAILANQMPDV
ncbi:MAG TPA: 16S rRNA (adenine(1518)-N(6)/adenine(1519)-N(6))-dimethyltransferase RsmA [Candidatus Avimonas sp.]|jgi:16S rRNA (adenine1518-N6/adenine1519-N6)-dimethyltransferase|nr:16S rRNA (adenine(1518)-N(6)/adenine(1519)-N(6))-dimethyltransferase RsmA [Clostridiales bacterium]HOB36120.1 16S rRNA (adenine(1518)-N(6)/adenine(1519)-N(6))-dimethyltransferase RsmA [Candidatus Avimonas sp.]HQA15977.1 16S rRNA (adenine(1518)-N(6)/adenine(1519)-N(6))-dimethyltransferase RsmA [Candidatus Avimonas sp.]HQD37494.1 16S rRNA (adenine(1518)-N(6)/adenine(1519)-N(6))-dimethyltransferase RsmA [Candidatus Avimonas sp.]